MLRLATQGEPDRLGDQIAAALHGKGRRVVRICAHFIMYVWLYLSSRDRIRHNSARAQALLPWPWPLSTQPHTANCRHACSTRVSRTLAECYYCTVNYDPPPGGPRARSRARRAR